MPKKGYKQTEEAKRKMSEIAKEKFGDKNPNWQSDWNDLKIAQKHRRMIKIIPKLENCSICNEKRKLELTNKDHKYSENKEDWQWLCYSCHNHYDYQFNGRKKSRWSKDNV